MGDSEALDALKETIPLIRRPRRSPSPWIIPFKAAMLGLEWPEVRRLFDER